MHLQQAVGAKGPKMNHSGNNLQVQQKQAIKKFSTASEPLTQLLRLQQQKNTAVSMCASFSQSTFDLLKQPGAAKMQTKH